MELRRPGERRWRLVEALLAVGAVVVLAASGCATTREGRPRQRPRSWSAAFAGAAVAAPARVRDPAVALAERALHDAGLRFGTDGSTRALWSYLRLTHDLVAPVDARPGDILFFDTRATGGSTPDCDDTTDHVGVVETITPDGRIEFVEARAGRVQRSFVDPSRPSLRRTAGGDIANSFLRAKAVEDPPDARYFAGELLCCVARALPARVPALPTK
jgi:hypothetical protein